MSEFGVGRSAVREAMLSLQKMGLVRVSSGERAQVTAPTADTLVKELSGAARLLLTQDGGIQQFQEARALFEIGLARLAAQRATRADIETLREALDANGRAIDNRPDFMRTDVAFHYVIAAMPGNPIFTSMYNAVVDVAHRAAGDLRARAQRWPSRLRRPYAHLRCHRQSQSRRGADSDAGAPRPGRETLLGGQAMTRD